MSRARSALCIFSLLTSAACSGNTASPALGSAAAAGGSAGSPAAAVAPPAAASSNSTAAASGSTATASTTMGAAAAAASPAASAPAASAAAPAAGAMTPATTPTVTPPAAGMPAQMQGTAPVMAMDECGLNTNYPGDNYCIKAPDKDKGWQLHIGPSSYDNPESQYLLMPGQEVSDSFMAKTTNDKKQFFYYRQFRMRPGAHHNIVTVTPTANPGSFDPTAGFDVGHRIGTSNHLSEDNPKGNMIAPENKGVGIPLEPNANVNVSLHSINTTDKPILRELWVNFWYRPESEVTDPVEELYQLGDTSISIAPHEETTLGPYTCDITGDGHMLWFYGHRHANNLSFSAWRVRGEQRDLFYLGYNWEDPIVLEYASNVTNMPPDPDKMIEGGWNGVLDFKTGDKIEWQCHVLNKTDGTLKFTNNTYTGEMCILDGELIGANCNASGGAARF